MPPRTLRCPECDARFAPDPDDEDRRRIRCPDCGAMVPNRDASGRPRKGGSKGLFIVLGIAGLAGLGCCGGIGGLFWWAFGPTSFPEPTQDYAEARKTFKTTLVTSGPSPQPWNRQTRPDGVKEVEYTSSGGLKLKAWVEPPAAGGPPKPAVLYLHNGFAFGADDWEQARPFRDAGFVTLIPTLRGENGQGGNFTLFYDEVDDVVAAAEVLAKTPGVDPNRIYVAGHSAGGTLAMLGAMTSPRFKAAASFSGSPDQVTFAKGQAGLAPFDQANKKEFAMRSPLAYYQSFKCPARLYYGDEEFPLKFSTKRLAEKATAAGADVKAVEVPGDHDTAVDPAMRQAIAFFQSK